MTERAPTLAQLRRYAVARTLWRPTTLGAAIERLRFVQADPLRALARAQDLVLRHRVAGYRAGDLERAYPDLPIEEDAFVNYGYLPRALSISMHPRTPRRDWDAEQRARATDVLEFVRECGVVHPREVDEHFKHGRVTNWFGGTSNASTQLLDVMHYRGMLRVAGRVSGTRTYALAAPPEHDLHPDDAMDGLLDAIVGLYAPLPRPSLRHLVSALRFGAPQWVSLQQAALGRLAERVEWATVDGVGYCWPVGEDPRSRRWAARPVVRLLAPFDPIVWDRRRFALLWGWEYRFEAYVPAAKRVRGHYALPLLWRDHVIGWGNLAVRDGGLIADLGFVDGRPDDPRFEQALAEELARMREFLGVSGG